MTEKLLAKGEVGQHQCDTCLKLFDFIGNGKWIPTTCPDCAEGKHKMTDKQRMELLLANPPLVFAKPENGFEVDALKMFGMLDAKGRTELLGKMYQVWSAWWNDQLKELARVSG